MRQMLRIGIPLAAVIAAIAGGVALATQPWDWGGEPAAPQVEAQGITYRMCDVTVKGPPPGTVVDGMAGKVAPGTITIGGWPGPYGTLTAEVIDDAVPVPVQDYQGNIVPLKKWPKVEIDAHTGAVRSELYGTDADKTLLKGVLNTVRVEPLDPATAPWPYTEATQVPVQRVKEGNIEYRWPDPGAGLAMGAVYSTPTTPVDDLSFITVFSCRSRMWVGMQTGKVLQEMTSIEAEDEAAFQNFLKEVKIDPESIARR